MLCGIVGVHQSGTYENRKSLQIKTSKKVPLQKKKMNFGIYISSHRCSWIVAQDKAEESHRRTDLRDLLFCVGGNECSVGGEFGGCWV